jgi:D-glycero-alpha-D-manno-heptose 1-phosphate guanylyltransferase
MTREAIILAGGLGTRLRGIVDELPKSMAPVNDRPFLYYLLRELSQASFNRVILATGYLNESIKKYFGNSFNGIAIDYSVEEAPLGTGGAIALAASHVKGDNVFILNGDTLFLVNYADMEKVFHSSGSSLTAALRIMERFDRYGSVTVNGNRIVSFNEKQFCERGLINGGVYLACTEWLRKTAPGKKFSFEKDILEKRTASDMITAAVFEGFFLDIGIPEDYLGAASLPQFS